MRGGGLDLVETAQAARRRKVFLEALTKQAWEQAGQGGKALRQPWGGPR
jgi:hypothetical protein